MYYCSHFKLLDAQNARGQLHLHRSHRLRVLRLNDAILSLLYPHRLPQPHFLTRTIA